MKKRALNEESIYKDDNTDSIRTRVVKSSYRRKGFRAVSIYILTSLFDEKKEDIEKIYLQRWNVELDIRNFKETLTSNKLLTKDPDSAVKELWVRLLVYNLVRSITVFAGCLSKEAPRKKSFLLCLNVLEEYIRGVKDIKLLRVVSKFNLNSKYRREPRALKVRKNRYPLLTTSREDAKKQDWGYRRRRPSKSPSVDYGVLNVHA